MSYSDNHGYTEHCTLPGSYELSGAHRTGTHNTRELLDLAASHGYEGVWAERLVGAVIVGLARHGNNHGLFADKRDRLRYSGQCSSGYVSRPDAELAVKLGLAADAKLAHDEARAEADGFDFVLAEAQFKDVDESHFCCLEQAWEHALLLLSDAFDNEVNHSNPRDRPSNHAWSSVGEAYAKVVASLEDGESDANHMFPALLLARGALVMTEADQSALGCLSAASVILDGPYLDGSDEDFDGLAGGQWS